MRARSVGGTEIEGSAGSRATPPGLAPWIARLSRSAALALVAGLALPLAAGCKKPDAQPTTDTAKDQGATAAIAVHVGKVEQRTLPRRHSVSGTLDADEQSELAAQASGTVLAVNVELGTRVKKGDVIVELDPREASLRLQSATAAAEQQRARLGLDGKGGKRFDAENVADVRAAKDALDLATTELDRAEALYKDGAIPKAQYDQAKSTKERAAAQYEVAKNSIDQTYAGLSGAEAQAGLSAKTLDDTKIRAPFDGVIAEKRISPGEFANVGRVVAVLVKDDPLRLKFDVAETEIAGIAQGAKVELHVAAFPEESFPATVKRIGASVRVQSRTLPLEAEVPNADRKLKPGFFARAEVELTGDPVPTLLAPKAALLPGASGARIFVKNGNTVSERLVTTGPQVGNLVVVQGQLSAGEEVAIDNVDKLSDAANITVAP
jgi:RND family efflux transporter MFP subunit